MELSSATKMRALFVVGRMGGVAKVVLSMNEPGPVAMVNQNVEPSPYLLVTPISPPISSTRYFEMESPSPVPPNFRVVEAFPWEKGWNIRGNKDSGIPTPESLILK